MADTKTINEAIEIIVSRYKRISRSFVKRIVEQIRKIGELSPSRIHDLIVMRNMNMDIAEITREIAEATQQSIPEILQIYQQALLDTYTDPRFREILNQRPLSEFEKQRLNNLARRISLQTVQRMYNYANTTAVSEDYRSMVDKEILKVSSGISDYTSAARDAVRELGGNGLRVEYESGYHRRLDSAVRMNIIDGTREIYRQASLEMGQIYGNEYDAIELSAHAMSAPDHEPIQGRVFLLEEWENMQNELPFKDIRGHRYKAIRRSIGIWNCKHYPMAFSTKYNKPRYTDAQLQKFIDDNHRGCYINGKYYTLYEASQLMREYETKIRREKDVVVSAQDVGDDQLRNECQARINKLVKEYQNIADQAGLKPQMDRTSVEGFRATKDTKKLQKIETTQKDDTPFEDVTSSWNDGLKNNSSDVSLSNDYVAPDGTRYIVDEINVLQRHSSDEIAFAEQISKAMGGKSLKMIPEVVGKYKKVKTPDFVEADTLERWEEKALKCTGKDFLRNEMSSKKAENYAFDVSKRKVELKDIISRAENVFYAFNTAYVKTIAIYENGIFVKVLQRK